MSSQDGKHLVKLVAISFVIGVLTALLTGFYSRTTLGQYCSSDPILNAVIDCSLQVNNRGLPLVYEIDPSSFTPKHGIQPLQLAADVVVWSLLSGGVILFLEKRKR